ncbi:hypothetical protein LTR84_003986 [Exophiala bonariae]|uniref:Beta-lactamase-related domain-containing protein n=1 Tax=Exophiala bonariae TaxID=1690606 RepID=A0AAV9N5F3_9EURO|nr:hypothetical protein LTR84_003986 [Exophiala bonariae]
MKQLTCTTLALAILPFVTSLGLFCPPTGPVLPPPVLLDANGFDVGPLTDALTKLVNDPDAPFNATINSFSLTITTLEDDIFQYHHTAPKKSEAGVSVVDGDTIYRIASVTKLFTTLSLLLQDGLDIDDFVWQHVPELAGLKKFEDITLRMLASHLSGVIRDGYNSEIAPRAPPEVLSSLGFPNVTLPQDYPTCDSIGTAKCSRAEFISGITREDLVWLPGNTPTYSNYAFVLLGYAVEAATGNSLQDVIAESIVQPLGMSAVSGLQIPEDPSKIIIPDEGDVWATQDFNNWKATGGLFTTPNDLSRFLRGIMNHELLTRAQTSAWLKPAAFTASPTGATGMPWGILRPNNLKRASGTRPLEIYTMLGGFPNYGAYVGIIPEYQLGITVNYAGPGDDPLSRTLLDMAVQHVIPVFDDLARVQASETYVGSYNPGVDGGNSSLVLALDDGPGLKIAEWTSEGTSVSEAWLALFGGSIGMVDVDMRIYPVGEDERWQVGFQGIPDRDVPGIFETSCDGWFNFNAFRYAGLPGDVVHFVIDGNGIAIEAQVPGLRQNLTRV